MTNYPGSHPCVECKYYVKPRWWTRLRMGQFAELCSHPEMRDPVDGTPTPCVTVRIMNCNGINKFVPAKTPLSA